jgi:phage protein D
MADKALAIAFNGKAVSQDFYEDIVSLTVTENFNSANTLELRLATELNENGAWAYLEDKRLDPFTKVSVKFGFTSGGGLAGALGLQASAPGGNDGLEPIFDGYITSVQVNLSSDPANAQIEIGAMDTSVLLSLEEKITTWKGMSDSQIAEQIIGSYRGVSVRADSTATVHQETDTTIVQRSTDIQFVRELATLNGLEFYFETEKNSGKITGFFRAPQLGGKPQPDLAIQFGDQSNLFTFSARLVGQRPLNVKVEQMDLKGNSPNTGQASETRLRKLGDKDANSLVGGPLGSLLPKDAQAQMLVLGPPTSNATELRTIAQAVRDEAAWFITAEGEINSDAYQTVLRPHRLVLVKGAGKPFSGKYYVTRVVHQLMGDGTYAQRFEARRNARDVDGSEQFGGVGLGQPIPGV